MEPLSAERFSADPGVVSPDAEPCPTPLSTLEVLASFEQDSTPWKLEAASGTLIGHVLGQGPPLYFLNSLDAPSATFRLLAWLLREEFRCVLFDVVPHARAGGSEVEQLLAVAEAQQDETFRVYASGFGGSVALAAALAAPARVLGAVLQGACAARRLTLLERVLLALARRSNRRLRDVPGWKSVNEQNHRRWFPPFDAHRWPLFEELTGGVSVRHLAARAGQLKSLSLHRRLGEISTPILCLGTEGEGRVLKSRQDELERGLVNCRGEWLKNTGLAPHWTHPHRVANILREFFADLHS